MKTHAFRLTKGQDLRAEIEIFAQKNDIKAGIVLTGVGILSKVILRMAGGKKIKTLDGNFEIISFAGTRESENSHLHISVADESGKTTGGHLKIGSTVGVTAEIVIGELEGLAFSRMFDKETGYEELDIKE